MPPQMFLASDQMVFHRNQCPAVGICPDVEVIGRVLPKQGNVGGMAAVGDSERSAGAILVGGVGQRSPCPETDVHQVEMVVAIKAADGSGELSRSSKLE